MRADLSYIKELITNGDLENTGKQLRDFTQQHSSRFHNEVVGQLANLKQLLADERKGIVSLETIKIQKNRITYALLELIDEIDEELRSTQMTKLASESSDLVKGFHFDAPIGQVIIQQSNHGDNIAEKKEKIIKIGENAQISAPIVIADSIEDSFNALAKSNINDDIKLLLEQLLKAINEINRQATSENVESAEMMAREAADLVKEVTGPKPRRRWYEVSIEGLKQAATNIGEVAAPILEIVGKLSPLLLG